MLTFFCSFFFVEPGVYLMPKHKNLRRHNFKRIFTYLQILPYNSLVRHSNFFNVDFYNISFMILKLKNMRVMIQDTSTNGYVFTPLNLLLLSDRTLFLNVNNILLRHIFLLTLKSDLIKGS